jgi:hypothetical protein
VPRSGRSGHQSGGTLLKITSAFGAVSATVAAALLAPAMPAQAAPALPCRATATIPHPTMNATEPVYVATSPGARVQGYAEYKTTTTAHAGITNIRGHLYLDWRISHATPGYRVNIIVKVAKGSQRGACSTWFTPVRQTSVLQTPERAPARLLIFGTGN